jgi:Zn-dependent peptidase ImmA (M78 family)/DNA-binding XRE family transcriptional regulator
MSSSEVPSPEAPSYANRVKITPALLVWARERAGLDQANVARKVGVNPEVIQSWESGISKPTLRQAEKLANALRVPFGYLFLSKPPQTVSSIPDFRRLPQYQLGRFSPELETVLNDAKRKQAWLREWRIEESFPPLDFIGKFSTEDHPKSIAKDIRSVLQLPAPTAYRLNNWRDHLGRLVDHAEKAGIVVIRNGVVLSDNHRPLDLEEFRGFNLADKYAPLVFINAQDSIAGQIFTLAHELAHLWLGKEGVSNPLTSENPIELPGIERFCNQIAAELLVPEQIFLEKWKSRERSTPTILDSAQQLAEEFKVSILVILLRAYELGALDEPTFRSLYLEAHQTIPRINNQKKGGGNFFATWQARNSKALVREVFSALQQGRVLYLEAARLLNTNIATLEKAFERYKQGRL